VTSCEFDERAAKSKFFSQSRPAICYSQPYKLITQGEELEISARLSVFHIVAAFEAAIYEIRVFVSRISPPLEHSAYLCFVVQNLKGVYLINKN